MAAKKTRLRRARPERADAEPTEAEAGAPEAAPARAFEAAPAREPAPAPRAAEKPPAQTAAPPAAEEEDLDFATLLAQSEGFQPMDLRVGDRVVARLIRIGKEDAFFELGPGQDGVMSRAELLDEEGRETAKEGDELELFVVGLGATTALSKRLARGGVDVIALEQAKEAGMPVEGKVTGTNKGGLEIDLKGARAFCPLGQMDIVRIDDPKELVGRTLSFLITELKEGGKNVLLSRRKLLEREREAQAAQLFEELAVGQVRTGRVERVTDFGAFVDLGGATGLVPMGQLAWGEVKDAGDVVSVGDHVTVEVQKIEDDPKRPGDKRIGLSMRTSDTDPWVAHGDRLQVDAELDGRVQRLESYGAFIEVADGVVGLAHISELSLQRIRHPSDVVQIGDRVKVRVLDVDRDKRRLSLTLKEHVDPADLPSEGTRKKGRVTRTERYGVFVELEGGVGSALVPAAETGTPSGTDLKRAFPLGTELEVMVTNTDDRGRVRASITALERAEERQVLDDYKKQEESSGGFGTFADLFKK